MKEVNDLEKIHEISLNCSEEVTAEHNEWMAE